MVDPLSGWALGYCLRCPDGESRFGRIQVLATLKKNSGGKYVVDRSNREELKDIFGPSGKVYWPPRPGASENLKDCIVRFRCERGREYGTSDEKRDWTTVHRDWERNGPWQVKRCEGYRLILESEDVRWRTEPRWIRSSAPGDRLFLRTRAEGRLIGPWRVGDEVKGYPGCRELTPELTSPKVYSFPTSVASQHPDILLHQYIESPGGELLLEALMYCPDPSLGKPIDLATPKQLADWLLRRIVEGAPRVVESLDAEEPGWRKKTREELQNRIDDDHQIHVGRWNRLESIFEHLAFDAKQTQQLLEHPQLKSIFEEAMMKEIAAKVAERSAEIEAEATRRAEVAKRFAEETIDHQEKRIDDATREANEAIAHANARSDEAKARLEALEARLRDQEGKWADRQRAFADLTVHLDESRDRLARDIALYQSLTLNGGATVSAATKTASAVQPTRLEGGPISSETHFVAKRLHPLIAERLHVHGIDSAWTLHAAVSGTRAILIPSPSWARVYVDALGGGGRLTFVNVAPTWLAFEDLWDGGLGPCWERATRDPSTIEIVLLRDFNRALLQCYARPLLDLIAGFIDEIPSPGQGAWPPTLRVLACPASLEASLPISIEVARHFAAIRDMPPEEGETPAPTPGHVTSERWLSWNGSPASPKEFQKSFIKEFDFGPLASSAAHDLYSIALRLKGAGASASNAAKVARDIRVAEPREYKNNIGNPTMKNS